MTYQRKTNKNRLEEIEKKISDIETQITRFHKIIDEEHDSGDPPSAIEKQIKTLKDENKALEMKNTFLQKFVYIIAGSVLAKIIADLFI